MSGLTTSRKHAFRNTVPLLLAVLLLPFLAGCFGGGSKERKAALTAAEQPTQGGGSVNKPEGTPASVGKPPALTAGAAPEQESGTPHWASGDRNTGSEASVEPPVSAKRGSVAVGTEAPESPEPTRRFATLDDAVEAGKLDPAVLAELRTRDSAEAIVTLEHRSILEDAKAKAPKGSERARAMIDLLRPAFAARKDRALTPVKGKVDIVEDYQNLALLLVRLHAPDDALALVNAPGVTGVRSNRRVPLTLKESLPLINQPQVESAGYRGSGTDVAVIDTGVDYTAYPGYFGTCTAPSTPSTCKLAETYEAATADGQYDSIGHGTHVASIIASVAPGTRILAADVFGFDVNAEGQPITENGAIAKAVNWVIGRKRAGVPVRAMNLSLGGDYSETACSNTSDGDTLDFATARSLNILPVVSAGNGAYDSGSFTPGIGWPACIPGAVSVGAVYDDNVGSPNYDCGDWTTIADQIVCFSQTGPNLSMLAPGSIVDAAGGEKQGTSMAAPFVAGAAAVLAAANPSASVDQIQTALTGSGPAITDNRPAVPVSRHRLDLAAARNAIAPADTTPPTLSGPTERIDGQLQSTTVPVVVSWSATDASGIKAYSVWVSADGGAWVQVALPTATTTSVRFNLSIGHTYRFATQAQDGAGNWSAWGYAPPLSAAALKADAQDDASSAITWSSGWSRYAWSGYAFGGYGVASSTAGATCKFTFTGRDVAWVAPYFSTAGQAKIYIDGTFRATVDLYSASLYPRWAAFWYRWATSGTHTITVQVVGTSGRPRVDVDAFAVLR